jgi:hypothetical protein
VPKQRRTRRTDRAREIFIATLSEFCNVSEAARAAGIARSTAYEWREDDAEFAALWDEAEQHAADKLEREAWRRAVEGVEKPVYYRGDEVGHVKEYSDRMLEILLKGHRPEKFVDRIKAEHSGSVPVTFNFIRQDEAPGAD